MLNLCKNAAEASPPGSEVIVELGVARHLGRDWAEIAVLDRGPGIPDEVVRELGSFVTSSKPEGLGAGIGLAVVQQVVEEHAGVLEVEARPEEGTRVRVLLPLRDEPSAPAAPVTAPGASERPRVLIVEDESALARSMARIAESAGFEVRTAATLASARAIFEADSGWPDALVLDLILPDGRGLELFEAIRGREPAIPVLAVSGFAERETTLALARAGCELLVKPFGADQLERWLRALPFAVGG